MTISEGDAEDRLVVAGPHYDQQTKLRGHADNNGLLLLSHVDTGHKHLKQQNGRSGTHCLEQITTVE